MEPCHSLTETIAGFRLFSTDDSDTNIFPPITQAAEAFMLVVDFAILKLLGGEVRNCCASSRTRRSRTAVSAANDRLRIGEASQLPSQTLGKSCVLRGLDHCFKDLSGVLSSSVEDSVPYYRCSCLSHLERRLELASCQLSKVNSTSATEKYKTSC